MANPHIIDDAHGVVSVISDFHKYSGVSDFSNDDNAKNPEKNKRRRHAVFEAFRQSDHVVMNGDMFDIQCAVNPAGKIEEACSWIKERLQESPHTHFHHVLGNHEAFTPFIAAMQELERTEPRFHFHEHYLKLGDTLYVHGDEVLGIANYVKVLHTAMEYGKKWFAKKSEELVIPIEVSDGQGTRSVKELHEIDPLSRKAYETFNGLHHKTSNAWKTFKNLVQDLYTGLESSEVDGLKEAFQNSKHVFSGHTHEAYSAHFKDKDFHNTGAAMVSMHASFKPLTVLLDHGVTSHVYPLLEQHREEDQVRPASSLLPGKKKQVAVVSDLHLFGRTSTCSPAVLEDLHNAFEKADMIVLNGDLFDITYPKKTSRTTMEESTQWIKEFAERYKEKEIHCVLGNHEAVTPFIEALSQCPNLHFHEHYFQPNPKTLFIHSDEQIKGKYKPRKTYSLERAQAKAYEQMAVETMEGFVQKNIVDAWRSPKKVAKNLPAGIEQTPGVSLGELQNVFMGHTHKPFIEKWMEKGEKGYWVTNTGSTTGEPRFAGCTFDMAFDGTITKPAIIPMQHDLGVVRM